MTTNESTSGTSTEHLTTILIPFLETGRRDWLQQAIGSFPKGTPYLVCENNGQLTEAINTGLEQVKTPYVLPFGADDVASPRMLEFLEAMIWDVDVAYPTLIFVDEELKPVTKMPAAPFCGNRLLHWNYVGGCSLIRTSALRAIGGWREMELLEDWDLFVRLHRAGFRFKPVPEALALYRQVPGSRNKTTIPREQFRRQIVGVTPDWKATWILQEGVSNLYRARMPARHLPGVCFSFQDWTIERGGEEFDPHMVFLDQCGDTLVMQCPGDVGRSVVMNEARSKGLRTVVEVDDDYFNLPPQTQNSWNQKIGKGVHTLEGHKLIARDADVITCTSEQIARKYRAFHPNVHVIPNSIDLDDWPELVKPDDDLVRVGWFASHSHLNDASLVGPALRWASEQEGVLVYVMGVHPPKEWNFQFLHIPWSNDYGVYQKMLQLLDIGLCPILKTPWSLCRSDLKALEQTVCGVTSILADQAPYDAWVRDLNCLKAATPARFLRHTKTLVENPGLRARLLAEANHYLRGQRLIEHAMPLWEEALSSDRRHTRKEVGETGHPVIG